METIAPINHIVLIDNGFGELEPVIAGCKITVHDIVGMYILGNSSVEWICENYSLVPAQIYAALAYYYDHKEQIDREIEADEALAEQVGTSLDKLIGKTK